MCLLNASSDVTKVVFLITSDNPPLLELSEPPGSKANRSEREGITKGRAADSLSWGPATILTHSRLGIKSPGFSGSCGPSSEHPSGSSPLMKSATSPDAMTGSASAVRYGTQLLFRTVARLRKRIQAWWK